MDNILSFIATFLSWRILLCSACGITISIFLSNLISSFDGRYGLLIISATCGFGVYWQEKTTSTNKTDIQKPISNVWFLITGFILFAILYSFLKSIVGALIISIIFTFGAKLLNTRS